MLGLYCKATKHYLIVILNFISTFSVHAIKRNFPYWFLMYGTFCFFLLELHCIPKHCYGVYFESEMQHNEDENCRFTKKKKKTRINTGINILTKNFVLL